MSTLVGQCRRLRRARDVLVGRVIQELRYLRCFLWCTLTKGDRRLVRHSRWDYSCPKCGEPWP